MEEINSNSNLTVYYIVAIVLALAAAIYVFFYMRRKKAKNRRLKNIMSKVNVDTDNKIARKYDMGVAMFTTLGMFVLVAASVVCCFYIKRLFSLEKDIAVFAGISFVSVSMIVFAVRLKINKITFDTDKLVPVVFNLEIRPVYSVPMFLTSVYTIIMAVAVPMVFVVTINKILYITIIGLIYILWLIVLTLPRGVSVKSVEKYYRSASVSRVIRYYKRLSRHSIRSDKATKALVSVNKVLAYLFYAEYGKAENEISKFKWNEQCEALKFNRKTLLAVKNYLDGKHLDGYKLARQAQDELENTIDKYASRHSLPEEQADKILFELSENQDIITDIGRILTGSTDRRAINKLMDKFDEMKKSNLPVSLLIAWCLCKAHASLGEQREHDAMSKFINEKAHNCKALNS